MRVTNQSVRLSDAFNRIMIFLLLFTLSLFSLLSCENDRSPVSELPTGVVRKGKVEPGKNSVDPWLKMLLETGSTRPDAVIKSRLDGTMDVNVMILTQSKHHLVERAIIEAGGSFRTSKANVIAATVPLLSIPGLSQNTNIKYIELGVYGQYSLNDSVPETKADRVHQGAFPLPRPYMGTGVVVGVIDSGIDFAHADFRNFDG